MTKKDYKMIAQVVYNSKHIHAEKSKETARRIAGGIANAEALGNPKFDRKKFLQACGLDD